jgi:hypothetical protein
MGKMRDSYKSLVTKPETKRQQERPRRRGENNITKHLWLRTGFTGGLL